MNTDELLKELKSISLSDLPFQVFRKQAPGWKIKFYMSSENFQSAKKAFEDITEKNEFVFLVRRTQVNQDCNFSLMLHSENVQ